MSVDNFDLIEQLLTFINQDEFYFLQIIKRKKDNSDVTKNNQVLLTRYIQSREQLQHYKQQIISLCEQHNARAYINLNVRNFQKVTCQCVKEFAQRICDNNYQKPYLIFDSVVGSCGASRDKRWLIDCDYSDGWTNDKINEMIHFINTDLYPTGDKYVTTIPTKNGVHIITTPFDLQTFRSKYINVDIHKNNPTILYCPN